MGDVSGCMTFVWEERTEKGKETPSRKTLFSIIRYIIGT